MQLQLFERTHSLQFKGERNSSRINQEIAGALQVLLDDLFDCLFEVLLEIIAPTDQARQQSEDELDFETCDPGLDAPLHHIF